MFQPYAKRVFDRYLRRRVLRWVSAPEQPLILDYPVVPKSRYGYGQPPHPELQRLFEEQTESARACLDACERHVAQYSAIPAIPGAEGGAPGWANPWFSGLDAMLLYSILATRSPRLYLEVGSGHSTRFARRAIQDWGLHTRIVSVDPHPRSDIDALCDDVFRVPFEDASVEIVRVLGAGDILFIDSSHRVFTNSDVTVLFLEVLPRLSPGVLVHVHDVLLPWDYPPEWRDRFYSEQYLLAALLLGRSDLAPAILVSSPFCSQDPGLRERANAIIDKTGMRDVMAAAHSSFQWTHPHLGTSIWLKTT